MLKASTNCLTIVALYVNWLSAICKYLTKTETVQTNVWSQQNNRKQMFDRRLWHEMIQACVYAFEVQVQLLHSTPQLGRCKSIRQAIKAIWPCCGRLHHTQCDWIIRMVTVHRSPWDGLRRRTLCTTSRGYVLSRRKRWDTFLAPGQHTRPTMSWQAHDASNRPKTCRER